MPETRKRQMFCIGCKRVQPEHMFHLWGGRKDLSLWHQVPQPVRTRVDDVIRACKDCCGDNFRQASLFWEPWKDANSKKMAWERRLHIARHLLWKWSFSADSFEEQELWVDAASRYLFPDWLQRNVVERRDGKNKHVLQSWGMPLATVVRSASEVGIPDALPEPLAEMMYGRMFIIIDPERGSETEGMVMVRGNARQHLGHLRTWVSPAFDNHPFTEVSRISFISLEDVLTHPEQVTPRRLDTLNRFSQQEVDAWLEEHRPDLLGLPAEWMLRFLAGGRR